VRTLIVHATDDHNVTYQQSVELAERIAGAELLTIEGDDHFVLVTHQDEISDRLQSFWQSLPGIEQH
jgi:pimeloyl-ACP methyl ester carboxylesterase